MAKIDHDVTDVVVYHCICFDVGVSILCMISAIPWAECDSPNLGGHHFLPF